VRRTTSPIGAHGLPATVATTCEAVSTAARIEPPPGESPYSCGYVASRLVPISRTPARTAAEAAALPLHGIWAVYNRAQDPWQLPEMRRFRRHWSRLLIDYVGKPWTRTWPIDGAFLWSVGSWDLAGVNPMSTSREGTFADHLVMTSMRLLSARVDGGRRRLLARRLLLQ